MFIKISINADSTAGELIAVSHFTNELALNRGAKVAVGPLVAPTDPAELDEPEVVVGQTPVTAQPNTGNEPPKRRRRTKEEVAAAAAAAAATTTEPEPETGNAEPAVTQTATETTTEAVDPEPATASRSEPEPEAFEVAATGKNYTEAEVQQIATVVARTHGADKVKAKIAELGGQRIAGLGQDKLNQLGDYLDGLSKTPAA